MTDFKVLDDREHVLLRSGMYIGSTSLEEVLGVVDFKYQAKMIVPGLIKCIEEGLQNSLDEFTRTQGKFADKIDITIDECDDLSISIQDNGRGIPVDKIGESYRPVLAWTTLRAGSNFDDSTRIGAGQNGVGISLVNIFSKEFIGETDDGVKFMQLCCKNNMSDISFDIHKTKNKRGTLVKFRPDLKRFGLESFSSDHVDIIRDRLCNLSIIYPDISFTLNGEKIKFSSLKNVATKFHSKSIYSETESCRLIICPSGQDQEFRCISYVNGIYIKNGGTHIDYLVGSIIQEMRPMIKKKWKIEVTPNSIKQHLLIGCWSSGFKNIKFDSQTKECIKNSNQEVQSHFNDIDFKKIAKQIIDCPEIIMPIIEAILWKKEQEEKREAAKLAKQAKKIQVVNHIEAQSKDPKEKTIFICEGQSAQGPIIAVRDAMRVGSYALRGKVMNTYGMKPTEILKNKEYFELCAVLGLEFGKSIDDLSYHKIAILTDQDPDGDSIYAGLLTFFSAWPDLFKNGHIYRAKSPLYVCRKGKSTKIFYTTEEYTEAKLGTSWEVNYIKGLGSLDQDDYSTVINSPTLVQISEIDALDSLKLNMAFGDDSNLRKDWMLNVNVH